MDPTTAERQQQLVTGLASELATVVSALLGSNAAAVAGAGPLVPGWVVACSVGGGLTGRLVVGIGDADASTLARRLMGMDEDPEPDAVTDTLGEVIAQATGGLSQRPEANGARIRVEGAASRGGSVPPEPPAIFDVAMEDGTTLRFACWARVAAAESVTVADTVATAPPMSTPPAQPGATSVRSGATTAPGGIDNLEVILDIELPLTVRFGKTEMTLQALTRVGPGSVIDLDRSPDEPVEILVNEKVVARGEVVVVSGNYGVRITEVTSAADRIRTLGP